MSRRTPVGTTPTKHMPAFTGVAALSVTLENFMCIIDALVSVILAVADRQQRASDFSMAYMSAVRAGGRSHAWMQESWGTCTEAGEGWMDACRQALIFRSARW